MNVASGFAYLDLATTQIRIAGKRLRESSQYINDEWLKSDLAEWRRLKSEARRSIRNSSLCDRPRLPQ